MTVEVTQIVGNALGQFYSPGFFAEAVRPLLQQLEELDAEVPLNEHVIRVVAGL